ncbi:MULTISPECIES: tetratricopeptide repeat protein [Vibrio]|uniref:Tetratricopeptide repeat protein n=2 Tax=Vibrio TaxID=662 RepID=A0A7X4RUA8_9VIBR|nr:MULTISPECIES: tetratricopeptide repeat protein [Vibrio]MBF9002870.1 tetratricopeptide repeat protein [Vibrio nitrifigilis]MZI92889.1 tetratricopeptide repeat protein [Vibrio eleionomae]
MNKLLTSACLMLLMLSGCASHSGLNKDATVSSPENAQEALKLAHILRDNAKYKAAYEVYENMDKKHQLKDAYVLEFATVAALVVSPSQAVMLFERAADTLKGHIEPEQQEAIDLGLGRAYLQLAQREEASQYLHHALTINPNNVTALNGLSVIANLNGHTKQARALLQKAIKIEPNNDMVLNNLAMTYLVTGETDRTIELLHARRAGLSLSGKLNLALAYILNERSDQARKLLNLELPADKTERVIAQFEQLRHRVQQGRPLATEIASLSQVPIQLEEEN